MTAAPGPDDLPPAAPASSTAASFARPPALEALRVALARSDLWWIGLAGFLVRGGVVPFLLAIVVVPTPIDVASALGPLVVSAALGGPNPGLLIVVGAVVALVVVWLALGWLLGAAVDVELVRAGLAAAAEDAASSAAEAGAGAVASPSPGSSTDPTPPRPVVLRALAVRLLAHLPLLVAIGLSVPAAVGATYHELVLPDELVTPIVLRVLRDIPGEAALVVAAWLVGETLGGLAVRAIAAEGAGIGEALAAALGTLVRRPLGSVVALVAGFAAAVVLVAPALIASSLAWRRLAETLRAGASPAEVGLLVGVLVGLWLAGFVLAGFVALLRALLWTYTFAAARPVALGPRTFG